MNGRNTVRYTKASTPHKRYPTCGLKIICNAIAFVCMCGARELNEAASGCEWIWVHRKSSIHFYLLSVPFKAHISACLSWPGEYPLHNTLVTHSLARSLGLCVLRDVQCWSFRYTYILYYVVSYRLSHVVLRLHCACLFRTEKLWTMRRIDTHRTCVYIENCVVAFLVTHLIGGDVVRLEQSSSEHQNRNFSSHSSINNIKLVVLNSTQTNFTSCEKKIVVRNEVKIRVNRIVCSRWNLSFSGCWIVVNTVVNGETFARK